MIVLHYLVKAVLFMVSWHHTTKLSCNWKLIIQESVKYSYRTSIQCSNPTNILNLYQMSDKSLSGQWCVHVVQWLSRQHIYHFNLLNCRKKIYILTTIRQCQPFQNVVNIAAIFCLLGILCEITLFRIAYCTISAENTFHTVHSMHNEYCKETCILW